MLRDKVRFVIVSGPRTGSTWLKSQLCTHPDILCHDEVLLAHFRRTRQPPPADIALGLLDEAFSSSYAFVGCKIHYEQLPEPPAIDSFLRNKTKTLHLIRRNILDIYLSKKISNRTKIWHVRDDRVTGRPECSPPDACEEYNSQKINVPAQKLREFAEDYNAKIAAVKSRLNPHTIYYDDVVRDGVGGIFAWLGAAPHEPEPTLEKLRTARYAEIITNFDPLRADLAGTDLEWMLADGS
jgi:LPS sulfotransferase NodH